VGSVAVAGPVIWGHEAKVTDLNVPYQFRMLAENPGLTAGLDKAETFAYNVQGLDRQKEEAKMPEWMKRGFHLPIPKGVPIFGSPDHTNYAMFDLPYADLYNGLRDYLSAGLPVIRNIVESYGIKQSVFTGAPLGKGDRLAVMRAHRQCVAVHEVLRQHVRRGAIQFIRLVDVQILGEDFQQIRAALGDVVRQ